MAAPSEYDTLLPGSLVAVTFDLLQYDIKKSDIWVARVTNIRKLRDVTGRVQVSDSPVRKQRDVFDEILGSVSKPKARRLF
jgi:hypothetical protein